MKTAQFSRHRRWTSFCEHVWKIAEHAWRRPQREEKRREEDRGKRSCAALWSSWQWLTGCVFALSLQPWKLVESRRRCCLLSIPVRRPPAPIAGRSGFPHSAWQREKGCTSLARNRNPRGWKKRPLSFGRHRRRRWSLSELSSSARDRSEAANIARLAGVLPKRCHRWRRSRPRPPRVSLSGTPPVPHRYPTDEFAVAWTRRIACAHPAWILRAFLHCRFSFLPLPRAFLRFVSRARCIRVPDECFQRGGIT